LHLLKVTLFSLLLCISLMSSGGQGTKKPRIDSGFTTHKRADENAFLVFPHDAQMSSVQAVPPMTHDSMLHMQLMHPQTQQQMVMGPVAVGQGPANTPGLPTPVIGLPGPLQPMSLQQHAQAAAAHHQPPQPTHPAALQGPVQQQQPQHMVPQLPVVPQQQVGAGQMVVHTQPQQAAVQVRRVGGKTGRKNWNQQETQRTL